MAKAPEIETPRRFYRGVSTRTAEDGVLILLDGRAPKTPAGAALMLPTEAAAQLVAAEWEAQRETIVFATMPATRLAFTAIDRTAKVREALAAEIGKYAGADLICYLADAPTPLVRRQKVEWGALLDWARDDLGVALEPTTGVTHRPQDAEALARIEALAAVLDDFALTGLAHALGLFGSAIIAFALQRGRLGGEAAFTVSRLDEDFQAEHWGVDAEAATRAAALREEAIVLERWFNALA
jgi:chaperone required for assembly of F1-ATPase